MDAYGYGSVAWQPNGGGGGGGPPGNLPRSDRPSPSILLQPGDAYSVGGGRSCQFLLRFVRLCQPASSSESSAHFLRTLAVW